MKNKSLTKMTAIVLLLTMIALAIISGTFAKYTEEYTGDSTAVVAKWRVDLTDLADQDLTESTTFNLFDKSKIYDLAGVANPDDLSGETGVVDDNVARGADNGIVAPGTWGKVGFKITIDATNEVSVKYGVDITSINNGIGDALEFSTDGKTWKKSSEISSLTTKTVAPNTAKTETVTLYWRWLYEDTANLATRDTSDTALGSAIDSATCVIEATLGATQVN